MPTAVAESATAEWASAVADIWIRVATMATLDVRWRSVECSLAD
jgi:hypothetical protein